MEIDKVCRLCGETSEKQMRSIFSKNDSGQQLLQLIKQCLPILVYRTDPLSKVICECCYSKLNDYSSFQKSTVELHDTFKTKLLIRQNESPVKLYVDILENAYQPESIQITNYRSRRPVRNCASQIQVDTRTNFTNTVIEEHENEEERPSLNNLTVLTPSKINEKSETNIFATLLSDDGTIRKKRRLAGPRCKTRPQRITIMKKQPLSLLQCALKQINQNLNLFEECATSVDSFQTATETETCDSYSVSQDDDDDEDYCPSPDMSLMEPNIHIAVEETAIEMHEFEFNINLDEAVRCNYCMKQCVNIVELAQHETRHIKVDIGPRVDTKAFNIKQRKVAYYYQDYLTRQIQPSKPIIPPKPSIPPKPIIPPTEIKNKNKINYIEKSYRVVDDDDSLLLPHASNVNHVFKIENNVILIDGVPIKSMDKQVRRDCYMNIMINEVKRKFCSLCRHTFKDNWTIENHYFSGTCMYTCKYCGRKFKYHKELFEDHLSTHNGEKANKIFGPSNRRMRFKKKKMMMRSSRTVLTTQKTKTYQPKVKPIKMKHLMQKRMSEQPATIKTEPNLPPMDESVTLEASSSNNHEPYQAYFCRKCFKVFFNVNEYNTHIRVCTGQSKAAKNKNSAVEISIREKPIQEPTRVSTPENYSFSKRPVRSCVKEISSLNDSDDADSVDMSITKKSPYKAQKTLDNGYDCELCCSSFPSRQSRNSHMRIHKSNAKIEPIKTPLNRVAPKSHAIAKPEPQQNIASNFVQNAPPNDFRYANLNPTVARLVQNNPHLTIRSYSKSQVEKPQEPLQTPPRYSNRVPVDPVPEHNIKRVYKCSDCDEKFENKSILYYHKINACIVKRHYECAFCKKKFGTYDQYNTHMFYVHPE